MALQILDCLNGRNEVIAECCCLVECTIYNGYPYQIQITDLTFSTVDFTINNILFNGNPISYPLRIENDTSASLTFSLCAPIDELREIISLDITSITDGTETFTFDVNSVLPFSVIGETELIFGDVPINSGVSLQISISDSPMCCNDYYLSTLTAPFSHSDGVTICPGSGTQVINVSFSPTAIGSFSENLTITINECNSVVIPLSGNGVEAPAGGNNVSGKRTVVDCPMGDCRLYNPQPKFAQTTKNAINQISRATRPKGGPGRGTNFR